ncbi:MAG TPA: PA2779 family protein [Ramlibacter sp.]|nr:PA2779 family protein [Ramlibacter sp.]
MKKTTLLGRGLIAIFATAMIAQTSIVRAEMISADRLAQPSQAEQDRAKVQSFVDRANVKERLQAMGVSGLVAKDRVAALTEEEVHALAQRIDAMPAGGALSNNDLIIILLIAILVALVL